MGRGSQTSVTWSIVLDTPLVKIVQSVSWLPRSSEKSVYDCVLNVRSASQKGKGAYGHISVDIFWSGGPEWRLWGLIKNSDWVGHAIGGRGDDSGVEWGVIRKAVVTFLTLADQRPIQIDLCGYGTAAIEVQVVFAAQLARLTQGRLAGCALLLKIAARGESRGQKWKCRTIRGFKRTLLFSQSCVIWWQIVLAMWKTGDHMPTCKLGIHKTRIPIYNQFNDYFFSIFSSNVSSKSVKNE